MFFKYFLILSGILFLVSCAQVGTINGGPEDRLAPKIIKSNPENGSTNFKEKTIILEFDEYLTLKNPLTSISIVPPDATVKAVNKGKEMVLNIEGELQENTTYTISMNGTVSDYTVGNDTIIQFVFSTGSYIDSLKYNAKIIDAFTRKPVKNALLALYPKFTIETKPYYYAQSDENGDVELNYLKSGSYVVRVFEDSNKDLRIQNTERAGFRTLNLDLSTSVTDTIPLEISTALLAPKIQYFTFKNPGLFYLAANASLRNSKVFLNDNIISETEKTYYNNDSISFIFPSNELSTIEVKVIDSLWQDSLTFKIDPAVKKQRLTVDYNLYNSTLLPDESLQIMISDRYAEVEKDKIKIFSAKDSTFRELDSVVYQGNKMHLYFDRTDLRDVEIIFNQSAYTTQNAIVADSSRLKFKIKTEKDFGTLVLDLTKFENNVLVDVLLNGKLYRRVDVGDKNNVTLKNLDPGSYTLRLVMDNNKNGKWDVGDFNLRKQAERIYYYEDPVKIRANWELELQLEP